MRARGMLTADARSQTEYGTLRGYVRFGIQTTTGGQGGGGAIAPAVATDARYFIQFAGFTFGLTDSFFDFYNYTAYNLTQPFSGSAVGPSGIVVAAYTAQFGNGLTASLSLEDAQTRSKPVVDINNSATGAATAAGLFAGFAGSTSDQAGVRMPEIVGNVRVDQAWGSAQIMGALHEVRARYYTGPFAGTTCLVAGTLNANGCGAPSDEWGWAVGAGLTLKMPWDPKDTLSFQVNYAEGAVAYVSSVGLTLTQHKSGGFALVPVSDAIFTNPGGATFGALEMTKGWSVNASFEHYWTPTLRTAFSVYYAEYEYSQAAANAMCAAMIAGGGPVVAGSFVGSCNSNPSVLQLTTRTLWNPVANLDIGLEVAYSQLSTAIEGSANLVPGNALASGRYALGDQDVWHATLRVQRNFWP